MLITTDATPGTGPGDDRSREFPRIYPCDRRNSRAAGQAGAETSTGHSLAPMNAW